MKRLLQGGGIAGLYDLLDRGGSIVEENIELIWPVEEETQHKRDCGTGVTRAAYTA